MRREKKMIQAMIPVLFVTGNRMCETEAEGVPGKIIEPTIPAMAIDEAAQTQLAMPA